MSKKINQNKVGYYTIVLFFICCFALFILLVLSIHRQSSIDGGIIKSINHKMTYECSTSSRCIKSADIFKLKITCNNGKKVEITRINESINYTENMILEHIIECK